MERAQSYSVELLCNIILHLIKIIPFWPKVTSQIFRKQSHLIQLPSQGKWKWIQMLLVKLEILLHFCRSILHNLWRRFRQMRSGLMSGPRTEPCETPNLSTRRNLQQVFSFREMPWSHYWFCHHWDHLSNRQISMV